MREALQKPINRCQLLLVGAIGVLSLGLCLGLGIRLKLADFWPACWFTALLCAGAYVYWRRGIPNFSLCFKSLAVLVGGSTVLGPLTYVAFQTRWPYIDRYLAAIDATLGVSAGAWVVWTAQHPWFDLAMRLTYSSVFPQIILVVAVLGFAGDKQLDLFVTRFMLAGLITCGVCAFFPAQGSCVYFGLPTPGHYVNVLSEMHRIRMGLTTISWKDIEGIVTFPSFHTVWAVLLIVAFRGWRLLFWPIAVLNSLVLLSCVTTGMHYFTDVLGGLAVTALAVYATRNLYPADVKSAAAVAAEKLCSTTEQQELPGSLAPVATS